MAAVAVIVFEVSDHLDVVAVLEKRFEQETTVSPAAESRIYVSQVQWVARTGSSSDGRHAHPPRSGSSSIPPQAARRRGAPASAARHRAVARGLPGVVVAALVPILAEVADDVVLVGLRLEAVFLAIFLTQGGAWVNLVDRFPVSFKSSVGGQTYRHIILATRVKATGLFGALGLSRRSSLMWKPPTFTSFALLIQDYQKVRQRLPPSPKLIGLSPQCPAGTCG